MQTDLITSTQTQFNHESGSVTSVINFLKSELKPNPHEPLKVTEIKDLFDYGNEYVFLLNFRHINPIEGITEEIRDITSDTEHHMETLKSSFYLSIKYDYTSNNHFFLLTFLK